MEAKEVRVIFVGIHNKGNLMPLCSSTQSGQLVDKIIKHFPNITAIKTNLYDTSEMPLNSEKHSLATNWVFKMQPTKNDIIILLGGEVQMNYIHTIGRLVKIPHPSPLGIKGKEVEYIEQSVNKIKQQLE